SGDSRFVVGLNRSNTVLRILDTETLTQRPPIHLPAGFWSASFTPLSVDDHAEYIAGTFFRESQPLGNRELFVLCWHAGEGEIIRDKLQTPMFAVSGNSHECRTAFAGDGSALLVLTDVFEPTDLRCFELRSRQRICGEFTTRPVNWFLSPDGHR